MYLDHIVHSVTKKPQEVAKRLDRKRNSCSCRWSTYHTGEHIMHYFIRKLAILSGLQLEHEEIAENANHPLINLMLHDLKTSGAGFQYNLYSHNNH